MASHAACKHTREPNYVRGFMKLIALTVVVTAAAYFGVEYLPI